MTEASQVVDDLLWVVNTPSLVDDPACATLPELHQHQIDSAALKAFVDVKPARRVGHYFERLLHFWFSEILQVDMLAVGLQLREGKRTTGELDFVYRSASGATMHCEAAVKFFLHHPRPGTSDFPGPNASDNFEAKTTKLFDQQLPASHGHPLNVDRREAFVRGMIFYHPAAVLPQLLPSRLAVHHRRGSWIRASELAMLEAHQGQVGAVAQKPHWFAPGRRSDMTQMSRLIHELHEHFSTGPAFPLMVVVCDAATLTETERYFVVSDRWPDGR